jgi:8-oxo-dGTP diphosphatase
MKLLYGTTNKAKLEAMRKALKPIDIEIISLMDLDLPIPDVDESGSDHIENARIKAMAYYKSFNRPVFSLDTGLYIEGLLNCEQPGTHVRMVNGVRLSDDEMVEYYTGIARRLGGRAIARYKNAICFVKSKTEVFERADEQLNGEPFYIVTTPYEKRREGFPLDSLSVHIPSGRYYDDKLSGGYSDEWHPALRGFFREVWQITPWHAGSNIIIANYDYDNRLLSNT